MSTEELMGIRASIDFILRDRFDYGNPEKYASRSNIEDRRFAEWVRTGPTSGRTPCARDFTTSTYQKP